MIQKAAKVLRHDIWAYDIPLSFTRITIKSPNHPRATAMTTRKRGCANGPGPSPKRMHSFNVTSRSTSCKTGFLDLPRELRDLVYGYALVAEKPISIYNFTSTRHHHVPTQTLLLAPALLAVSRTLHAEGVPILYGLNTFCISLRLDLDHAQHRYIVDNALRTLRLPPDFEGPIPDVVCVTDRPRYLHPRLGSVKRLEVKLETKIPTRSPLRQSSASEPTWADHRFADVCRFLVERGSLDLLIVTTAGYGQLSDWKAAGRLKPEIARHMQMTMSYFHEWHLERARLAAQRRRCALWIHDKNSNQIRQLQNTPVFHTELRALADALSFNDPSPSARRSSTRFFRTGQLRKCSWVVVPPLTR